ncbi:hypothetical protein [Streptomyces griseus]|uniref:hypothetical protein n=1 Tax=Streptomyces griseus TaxID=1911 RepID=UPI00068EB412|nr:hypothetical protein [Streptomyces griseus]
MSRTPYADGEGLCWELVGWEGDDHAAHVTELTRDEIRRVRDLFPDRTDDWFTGGVHPVPPGLQDAVRAAVPRLEFQPGLDYFLDGVRTTP